MIDKTQDKRKIQSGLLVSMSIIFLVGLCLSAGWVHAASSDVIKLRLSSPYFEQAAPSVYAKHMCDLIEKKTNGKVKIERFYGGTLGSDKEHPQMVGSGSVDMAVVAISIFTQLFPLNNVQPSVVALGRKDTVHFTNSYRSVPEVKAILETEQAKANIKIFAYNAAGVNGIVSRNALTSMKDLKGKKINTHGPTARPCWMQLGWIPVNVTPPDVYESLSRGVMDGGYGSLSAALNMKWYELGKTYFSLDAWTAEIPIMMNWKKFNSLPADIQKAFVEAANETAEWSIDYDATTTATAFKVFEKAGCKVLTATAEERNLYCDTTNKFQIENTLEACKKAKVQDQAEKLLKIWKEMYADARKAK